MNIVNSGIPSNYCADRYNRINGIRLKLASKRMIMGKYMIIS